MARRPNKGKRILIRAKEPYKKGEKEEEEKDSDQEAKAHEASDKAPANLGTRFLYNCEILQVEEYAGWCPLRGVFSPAYNT